MRDTEGGTMSLYRSELIWEDYWSCQEKNKTYREHGKTTLILHRGHMVRGLLQKSLKHSRNGQSRIASAFELWDGTVTMAYIMTGRVWKTKLRNNCKLQKTTHKRYSRRQF